MRSPLWSLDTGARDALDELHAQVEAAQGRVPCLSEPARWVGRRRPLAVSAAAAAACLSCPALTACRAAVAALPVAGVVQAGVVWS